MGTVSLLYANEITSDKISEAIIEITKNSGEMIYLMSSHSLKSLRFKALTEILTDQSAFTFAEFEYRERRIAYSRKDYITKADQRFLLNRLIDTYFKNSDKLASFQGMRRELFTLYDFIMFNNVPSLTDEALTNIESDYSVLESDIFRLYNRYHNLLDDLKLAIKTGEASQSLAECGISGFRNSGSDTDILNNRIKDEIDSAIGSVDTVFFDGFVVFTDIQKYAVESAIRQDKDVIFICKMNLSSRESAFIYEDNYKKIANAFGKEIKLINLDSPHETGSRALDYFRDIYPRVFEPAPVDADVKILDGSIELIAPFNSREDEIAYVVRRISEYLQGLETLDPVELKRALDQDIAISLQGHVYDPILIPELKRVGLFILRDNIKDIFDRDLDSSTLQTVYFAKDTFMTEPVAFTDGTLLNTQQKYILFERGFQSLSLRTTPRPISSYPVGQYIRQIYNFAVKGMDTHGFKLLLYSNWNYLARKTDEKWDSYISDFQYIEPFFKRNTECIEWLLEFDRLIELRESINSNDLYVYHPLRQVSIRSLKSLRFITEQIGVLLRAVNFTGTVEEHISVLVSRVIDAKELIDEDRDTLELEQVIICKLYEAAQTLGHNAFVSEIDVSYFAANLINMLEDFEKELLTEEQGEYTVNTFGMQGSQKIKQVFFIMAERGRYPQNYRETFPFSSQILSILSKAKYGIECIPARWYGMEYHVLLQNHGFMNFLDCIQEKLVITSAKYAGSRENKPSIYCEDIATAFGKNLSEIYIPPESVIATKPVTLNKALPNIEITQKCDVHLTELATFLLCPKLYAHLKQREPYDVPYTEDFQLRLYFQAILLNDLITKFALLSDEERRVYSACDTEGVQLLQSLFDEVFNEHHPAFSFLLPSENEDAKTSVMNKAVDFLFYEAASKTESGYFTVTPVSPEPVHGNGYTLHLDYDIQIKLGTRRSAKSGKAYPLTRSVQNSFFLDFLVQRSKQGGDFLEHYRDILAALNSNDPWQDRIYLIHRVISKINAQFDSGSAKFRKDGLERTDKLVEEIAQYDFSQPKAHASSFCGYCRLNSVCRQRNIQVRRARDEA